MDKCLVDSHLSDYRYTGDISSDTLQWSVFKNLLVKAHTHPYAHIYTHTPLSSLSFILAVVFYPTKNLMNHLCSFGKSADARRRTGVQGHLHLPRSIISGSGHPWYSDSSPCWAGPRVARGWGCGDGREVGYNSCLSKPASQNCRARWEATLLSHPSFIIRGQAVEQQTAHNAHQVL